MPLCSRRAWKTPAGFPTWPTPGCYDDGVVLPRFNLATQTGRRRVFIMTTIQTHVALRVPVLTRHNPDHCPSFIPTFTAGKYFEGFNPAISPKEAKRLRSE